MKSKLLILILIGTTTLYGLDFKQILRLKTVKNVAMQYPDKRGQTFEDTMMAICLTETNGGTAHFGDPQLLRHGIKKASYGIMQVRLGTARHVGEAFGISDIKKMSDLELVKRMMHDDLFNIKIATLYLVWCSNVSGSYFETVSRYNGGKVNHPYYNKVQKNLARLKEHDL